MGDNYGRLWTKEFGDTPTGENSWAWTVAIKDLTTEQITSGISRVIQECLKYPPKPIQFRGLCLGEESENADKLFYQVAHWGQLEQSEKTREGLYIIRNLEDYSLFRRLSTDKARQMFDKAYSKMLRHIEEGRELPEFHIEIEYEEKPALPKEELRSRLQGILEGLGAHRMSRSAKEEDRAANGGWSEK